MNDKLRKLARQIDDAERLETKTFNAVLQQPILEKDWSAYRSIKAHREHLESQLVNAVMTLYEAEKRGNSDE